MLDGLYPRKALVLIFHESEWILEQVWTRSEEKSLPLRRPCSNPGRLVRSQTLEPSAPFVWGGRGILHTETYTEAHFISLIFFAKKQKLDYITSI